MHCNHNKRPSSAIEEDDARQSKKPADDQAATITTEDLVMTEAEAETETEDQVIEVERKIKTEFRTMKPCIKEDVVEVSVPANGQEPFYISGLKDGLKEGLAIAAYHDVPPSWHASERFTADLNARRLAEVRGVIELMLDHVAELSNLCKSSSDLHEKLTHMLGATWTGLMCPNAQGSGQGTIQVFACYYNLVAA